MPGIVVFGGTVEGRRIAEDLQNTGIKLTICVATDYGASLLPACDNIVIHTGRMEEREMEIFLADLDADYCLDATHPYAAAVTENIRKACGNISLPYIRVYREEETVPSTCLSKEPYTEPSIAFPIKLSIEENGKEAYIYTESTLEAVDYLRRTQGNILITAGSKELEEYTKLPGYRKRCYVRVLPAAPVLEKCRALGFAGKNLIGMQGPFSEEFNYALMKQINASWLVTKNSGAEGGYPEKCEAAQRAGVNILVIGRAPERMDTGAEDASRRMKLQEALAFLKQFCQGQVRQCVRRNVYLVGMGPGASGLLTREAEESLQKCDVIIGSKRMLELCPGSSGKPAYQSCRKEEIVSYLKEHEEYKNAAVVYSGDIGFYSGARGMRELLTEYEVHCIPGIASPVYFLDKIGIPWDEVCLVSCHGKDTDLLPEIKYHGKVCALTGSEDTVADTCRRLLKANLDNIIITVGERLSYPEEVIITGRPEELLRRRFDRLSVVLFENPLPDIRNNAGTGASGISAVKKDGFCLEDSAFRRGSVPMTKQEVRLLSLAKLKLKENSVLYDIGAGTGSVSVEASRHLIKGKVYAVERNPEAVCLIRQNREKFRLGNMVVIQGEAPGCLKDIPAPTHVFIGGSGGRLMDIIRLARERNPQARFVINAVTLETISLLKQIKDAFSEYSDMEVIQVNISKSRPLGGYHMLAASNPVFIISFGGGEERYDGE